MKVNNEKESDNMEKNLKKNNPEVMNLLERKSTLKHFGFKVLMVGLSKLKPFNV